MRTDLVGVARLPPPHFRRADPAFDHLIRKVYPDLEAYEAKEAAAISATNKRENFNNAFTAGVEEAVKAQRAQRKVGRVVRVSLACTAA